ncbi:hypothetical protein Dimus_031413 [Dionaea muscipula]
MKGGSEHHTNPRDPWGFLLLALVLDPIEADRGAILDLLHPLGGSGFGLVHAGRSRLFGFAHSHTELFRVLLGQALALPLVVLIMVIDRILYVLGIPQIRPRTSARITRRHRLIVDRSFSKPRS